MSNGARPVILAGLLAYILLSPAGLAQANFNVWSWFHYWLGARYYEELGYKDLYTQAFLAQKESGGPMGKLTRARDLDTYRSLPLHRLESRSERWTEARWEAFKEDLESLQDLEDRWVGIFLDRGFNGSPAWVTVSHYIDRVVDLRTPLGRWFGRALDPLLILAMAAFLLATVGPLRGGVALGIFLVLPTTLARFPGSLLQYDVFALVVVACCLVSRRRLGLAGLCLGYATALRLFPAVFVAALLARALLDRIDGRGDRAWWRFVAGLAIGLILAFVLGCLSPRGPTAWSEFADNTRTHQAQHLYGNGRIGLEHLFTIPPGSAPRHPPKKVRQATRAKNAALFRASQVGLFVLVALAARRRDATDTFILALVALFAAVVASRYYWAVLALWPLLGWKSRDRKLLVIGTVGALVPILAVHVLASQGRGKLFCWLAFEQWLLLGFVVTCGLLIVRDVRRYGIRAWLLPGIPERATAAERRPG